MIIGMALGDIWKVEDILMDSVEAEEERERSVDSFLVPDLASWLHVLFLETTDREQEQVLWRRSGEDGEFILRQVQ